jgi:hypothetical protein
MKACGKVVMLALAAIPFAAFSADEPKGQELSCIKDVTWSHEFLERYPNAAPACREVKVKDGEKWVRFEAKVKGVKKNEVTLDFLNVRGDTLATATVAPKEASRLKVGGKDVKYSSLRAGDTLDVWMPESRLGFYAEPGASEVTELPLVRREEPKK